MKAAARDEDGATAVLVAMCLLLLFGAGAIAVDLGSGWETQRQLVVDTDAAALAGAAELVDGDCSDARAAVERFLQANGHPDASPVLDQDVFCNDTNPVKTVRVEWDDTAQQTLATTTLNVAGGTTAALTEGDPVGGGLRPWTVCMLDEEIIQWIDQGPGTPIILEGSPPGRGQVGPEPSECGNNPGNWTWTCFDRDHPRPRGCGGNSGNPGVVGMISEGYGGDVDLGSASDTPQVRDCAPDEPGVQQCDSANGVRGGSLPVNELVGKQFPILGVSAYNDGMSTPHAFIGVEFVKKHGNGAFADFEFKLVNLFNEGTTAVVYEGTVAADPIIQICADRLDSVCPGDA